MTHIPLGTLVKDKVTGFTGVTDNRASFMYGCDRYYVQPLVGDDGKIPEGAMIDAPQLEIIEGEKQVMTPLPEPPQLVELGQSVSDPIRGMSGIVTGRAVYLNGCSRVCVTPEEISQRNREPWWVDEQQVVGKKTFLGKDKIPVQPDVKRTRGGPAPHNSKR